MCKFCSLSPTAINGPTSREPGQAGNTPVFKQDIFLPHILLMPLPSHLYENDWAANPAWQPLPSGAFLDHSRPLCSSFEHLKNYCLSIHLILLFLAASDCCYFFPSFKPSAAPKYNLNLLISEHFSHCSCSQPDITFPWITTLFSHLPMSIHTLLQLILYTTAKAL